MKRHCFISSIEHCFRYVKLLIILIDYIDINYTDIDYK